MQKYRIDYYKGTAPSTDLVDQQYLRFKNHSAAHAYAHEHLKYLPEHSYPEIMKIREPIRTEPLPPEIDMQQFLDRFTDNYEYLYDNNNLVEEYGEALDAGDLLIGTDVNRNFISRFNAYRGEYLTSDREIAAFALTVNDFVQEYLNQISPQKSFEVGNKFRVTDIFTGGVHSYEIVARDKDKISCRAIYNELDGLHTVTENFEIRYDEKEKSEYIVAWSYREHEGRIYPEEKVDIDNRHMMPVKPSVLHGPKM